MESDTLMRLLRVLLSLLITFVPLDSYAQTITGSSGSGSSAGLTAVFTYSAPTTNPSVFIVAACGRTPITVADTGTHTWNEVATRIYNTNNESHMWYANNTSTTAPTVTITSTGSNFNQIIGIEVTGLLASGSLDQTGVNDLTGTSLTVTSGVVTQAIELVVSTACSWPGGNTFTAGAGDSIVIQQTLNGFSSAMLRQTATTGLSGAQAITTTVTTSRAIGGVIGTFKASATATAGQPIGIFVPGP